MLFVMSVLLVFSFIFRFLERQFWNPVISDVFGYKPRDCGFHEGRYKDVFGGDVLAPLVWPSRSLAAPSPIAFWGCFAGFDFGVEIKQVGGLHSFKLVGGVVHI